MTIEEAKAAKRALEMLIGDALEQFSTQIGATSRVFFVEIPADEGKPFGFCVRAEVML